MQWAIALCLTCATWKMLLTGSFLVRNTSTAIDLSNFLTIIYYVRYSIHVYLTYSAAEARGEWLSNTHELVKRQSKTSAAVMKARSAAIAQVLC